MKSTKETRPATSSCTECQRRKQKCSREWPCNHCQARKVPQLCQFGVKKGVQQDGRDSGTDLGWNQSSNSDDKSLKRGLDAHATDLLADGVEIMAQDEEAEDGLKTWGYMPGHVHYNIGHVESGDESRPGRNASLEPDKMEDSVRTVLPAIPPRSITDAIVNHFLTAVNHRYNAIYPPTFTEAYVRWWTARANGRRLRAEFTCLLLRVCAYSVQYSTPALRKLIEFELACNVQTLTERFASAAEQLCQNFSADNTCVERVQGWFLKATWLKSESRIVESWHALGCAIREAQELGLDNDTNVENLSEFDVEIRRRVWCLLFIWDWQMSVWLSRPHLINQKDLTFQLPNRRLDRSPISSPNAVSPFEHIALEAELARRVVPLKGDAHSISDLSVSQVQAIQDECSAFIAALPPVFRVEDTDCSLDDKYPWYVLQRCQLHVVMYMTQFDFLKPWLTSAPSSSSPCSMSPTSSSSTTNSSTASTSHHHLRTPAIHLALRLMRAAQALFEHEFPINAKFHLVVFSVFDTATVLCSALIHDVDGTLPCRHEVVDAIKTALDTLRQLSATTKMGKSSFNFLARLARRVPGFQMETSNGEGNPATGRKRIRVAEREQNGEALPDMTGVLAPQASAAAPVNNIISPDIPAPTNFTTQVTAERHVQPRSQQQTHPTFAFDSAATVPSLTHSLPEQSTLPLDINAFTTPLNDTSNQTLDIGGMEQIWDWETLNLSNSDFNFGLDFNLDSFGNGTDSLNVMPSSGGDVFGDGGITNGFAEGTGEYQL